ncbi:DUF6233 domain-containing protein [Streptomyces goshikiensis]|uniref:DUF6233 domain-containing protein n=1 Tax=Streptomyces goshikiensis TaxID=1942 RepID=UPI00364F6961
MVERGIGVGRLPVRVHAGDCWDTRSRCAPASADQRIGDRQRRGESESVVGQATACHNPSRLQDSLNVLSHLPLRLWSCHASTAGTVRL